MGFCPFVRMHAQFVSGFYGVVTLSFDQRLPRKVVPVSGRKALYLCAIRGKL